MYFQKYYFFIYFFSASPMFGPGAVADQGRRKKYFHSNKILTSVKLFVAANMFPHNKIGTVNIINLLNYKLIKLIKLFAFHF